MSTTDVIWFEEKKEPSINDLGEISGTPIMVISYLGDNRFDFRTCINNPMEALWVLEHLKKQILED